MNNRTIGTYSLNKHVEEYAPYIMNQTRHTPYEVMCVRKLRFPSEIPVEEEVSASISLKEPTPNEVAEYLSSKQVQLTEVEAKVCCLSKL